ncbi:MAG: Clp protease N-terminal domain-containing protein [Gemmatimonas sp.]
MRERSIAEQQAFLRSGASFHVKLVRLRRTRYLSAERFDGTPGIWFGRLAERIVGPRITEAEIEPCLADMQHEYFEALASRNQWKARIALLRGHAAMIGHVLRNLSGMKHRFERQLISALEVPERFDEDSRAVGQLAHDHTKRLGQSYVCADGLLLALLDFHRTNTIAKQCGVDVDALRRTVEERNVLESETRKLTDVIGMTSGLYKAWEEAHWEANSQRKYFVEPEHLLVGLVRDRSCLSKAAKDFLAAGFALLALLCVSVPAIAQSGARSEPRTIALPRANATIKEKFSSVSSVRELKDGRVIVTDNRDHLVYVADFAGNTSAHQLGRHGKGPGEYEQVGQLWPLGGDSTVMLEPMAQRGLVFNGADIVNTLTGTAPLLSAIGKPFSIFLGRDVKGAVLAQVMSFGKAGPNPADSMLLVRAHAIVPKVDTLSRVSSVLQMPTASTTRPVAEEGGGARANTRYPVNLRSRDQSVLFPDGAVAILRSNPYRVDWCMPTGNCRQGAVIEPTNNAISDEAKEAIILWQSRTSLTLTGRHASETTGWPATLPAFIVGGKLDDTAVLAEPRGDVLVERIPTTSPAFSPYDILDRNGQRIATLRLEVRQRVVGFGKHSVYIVDIDNDGLQSLQRHEWKY